MWLMAAILNSKSLMIPDKAAEGESQIPDQPQPFIFYKISIPYRRLC